MSGKALNPNSVPFLVHRLPVEMPTADPDTSPEVSVCFNEEWLPHVLACLKALVDPAAWQATTQADLDETMKRSMYLLDMFAQAGPCVSPPGVGCFKADFHGDDYAFVPEATPGCDAVYTAGVGWSDCLNSSGVREMAISRLFSPAATQITSYEVKYTVGSPNIGTNVTITFLLAGSVTYTQTGGNFGPGAQSMADTPNVQADQVIIDIVCSGGTNSTIVLDSLELCYVGTFPLSTPQATFEHTFDFLTSNGGFSAYNPGGGARAAWSSGVGWHDPGNGYMQCQRLAFSPRIITSMEFYTVQNPDTGRCGVHCNDVSGLVLNQVLNSYTVVTGLYKRVSAPNFVLSGIWFGADNSSGGCTLAKLIVRGIGTDPF